MAQEVAIIGAGLSGLTLALALHQQGIKSTVYEARAAPLNIGGAVMLSPNALKILDALHLYKTVQSKGYNFERLDFQTPDGTFIDSYEFGSEPRYGYKGNRIYRFELIDAVMSAVNEGGIKVHFGHKFSHVIEETEDHVKFVWSNGTVCSASLLVGADGIHSSVRKYLHPDLKPRFTHMIGITAAVPAAQVSLNQDHKDAPQPITILNPQKGAFVLAPQKADGSEYLIGKQKLLEGPEPDREEWTKIHADKDACVNFLKQDAEVFGPIAVGATSNIPIDKINLWPFYVIPSLDRWASDHKRVVILGDAAHAIPPSAGQGINQAFEDVYMLALLLGRIGLSGKDVGDAMAYWQQYRQARVYRVLDLNRQIDARRVPGTATSPALATAPFNLKWLYTVDIANVVEKWMADRASR